MRTEWCVCSCGILQDKERMGNLLENMESLQSTIRMAGDETRNRTQEELLSLQRDWFGRGFPILSLLCELSLDGISRPACCVPLFSCSFLSSVACRSKLKRDLEEERAISKDFKLRVDVAERLSRESVAAKEREVEKFKRENEELQVTVDSLRQRCDTLEQHMKSAELRLSNLLGSSDGWCACDNTVWSLCLAPMLKPKLGFSCL